MRRLRTIVLLFGVLVPFLVGSALAAERRQPKRRGHAPIAWVGAGLTNVVYLPLKIVYAGSGSIVAGLAYLVTAGDEKAFFGIWNRSAKGTYIVTPAMLEGKKRVRFKGP